MGITAGHVNAIDYCSTMMNFPTLFDLVDLIDENDLMNTL